LSRHPHHIAVRQIKPAIKRTIAIAYKNKNVLPIASRYFIDFIIREMDSFRY